MFIAARVKRFLNQNKVCHRILNYERRHSIPDVIQALHVPTNHVLKAFPVTDGVNIVLAVMPWDYEIDLASVELELHSVYHTISREEIASLFCDCEKGCIPPFGEIYHLQVILDKSIETLSTVYLETGSSSALLEMALEDFLFLNGGAPIFSFAHPIQGEAVGTIRESLTLNKTTSRWGEITEVFPTLPLQASKILELAEILMSNQKVPLLKENSHSFKFSAFDQMALARAAHQIFTLPTEAYLGSKTFWKHALYAANLAERLCKELSQGKSSREGEEPWDFELAYMLGFTHNFGLLLFGHLFFHEYRLLSKWVQQNPDEPIEYLERKLLGMGKGAHLVGRGHAELGAWLMQHWNMPEVFMIVAEHHHDIAYEGPYASYIALVQLTNQLLNKVGIAREALSVPIEQNLKRLNISQKLAESILAELMASPEELQLGEVALNLVS